MDNLRFTDAAEADLEAIGDHVARDNPAAAARLIQKLRTACLGILKFPNGYSRVPRFESRDVRRVVSAPYLIIYSVRGDHVLVLRILHGARDFDDDDF